MKTTSVAEYFIIEVNQSILLGAPNTGSYAGFIIINNIQKTQSWSPHFYKALGFNQNEITPSFESLEKILHPSDFDIIKNLLQDFSENLNKNLFVKMRYRTKNNIYMHLNSRIKTICNVELSNRVLGFE